MDTLDLTARIDAQLAERAPWLFAGNARSSALRTLLCRLLSYDATLRIGRQVEPLDSGQVMDHMAALLAGKLSVSGLHRLPKDGPALVVCNHPTGIADAIMLWSAIAQRREDAYFFANRDILTLLPQMADMIAPVEWRLEKRSHAKARETLAFAHRATQEGRLGVIFPSGRLAYREGLRLKERPWMTSAATLARKLDLPVIPVHLESRNSALFYLLSALHPSLRDITLFHETLNKAAATFRLHVGRPVLGRDLPADPKAATQLLRVRCLCDHNAPLLLEPPQHLRSWLKSTRGAPAA